MVLFPEGGFLHKRREVSQRYAEKNNLPILKNVSLPRIGALKAIFDVLPTRSTLNGNNNGSSPTKRVENGGLRTITNQGNLNTINNKLTLIMQHSNFLTIFFFQLLFVEQLYQYQNKKDEEHKDYMDYVLDITIAYPDGKPIDLPNIVTGMRPPCQTFFLYRLYHTSEVRSSDFFCLANN